ncbi:MAG: TetR/AcrR family transcriptional regulator [Spirochaetales bacterium]|nr:TetR/AcrR family transcriptional regulator [Spirochaetales bacterium]
MQDTNSSIKKYYKPTFEKIPSEKRKRIIDTAISEFAANGYNATSINTIAKKACISIGSMYSYFDSKESLFMTLLDQGYKLLSEALGEVIKDSGDFYSKFKKFLKISHKYATDFREINQIYIDISTEGLSHLANEMSLKMESDTSEVYHKLIEQAKSEGIISEDIDSNIAAFCLDNIVMMVQFSYASAYYRERMKFYLQTDTIENDEEIINGIVYFIENGLRPRNK